MKKFLKCLLLVYLMLVVVMSIDEQRVVMQLKKVTPSFSASLPVVKVVSDEASFELRLYDSAVASEFVKKLPQKMIMTRWGDGSYSGSLSEKIDAIEIVKEKRRAFFKGEVVLHRAGKAIFLMFGPTPVGFFTDHPMLLSSDSIPFGQLTDYSALENLAGIVEFEFDVKK